MKKIIVLLAFLQLSVCFAQQSNGGRRGNVNAGQTAANNERPKFEASKVAGIYQYEPKKVLKKVKIKKGDSIAIEVNKSIETYNSEINKLQIANKDLFEGLDIVVNQNIEVAIKNRNKELMRETTEMIEEKLKPIREEVKKHHDSLNMSLQTILTEEQNKKWLNYQKSEIAKLMPKRRGNDAKNRSGNTSGKSRRRRG